MGIHPGWHISRSKDQIDTLLLLICSFILFHALIQTDLPMRQDTDEQLRIKGPVKGPNRYS